MSLTLIAMEVPVGEFRLDILGLGGSRGGLGLPAISGRPPAHLDWLNERTDTGVDFFGVEVSVVQIGETGAPCTCVLKWSPAPTAGRRASRRPEAVRPRPLDGPAASTPCARTSSRRCSPRSSRLGRRFRIPTRGTQNWISFASGPWGYWALSIAIAERLRIEAYIDTNDANLNKTLFDELHADASSWETKIPYQLAWERLDGKRASRIAAYRAVTDLSDPAEREQLRAWAAGAVLATYDAMNDRLRSRARQLREALKTQTSNAGPEPATTSAAGGSAAGSQS